MLTLSRISPGSQVTLGLLTKLGNFGIAHRGTVHDAPGAHREDPGVSLPVYLIVGWSATTMAW